VDLRELLEERIAAALRAAGAPAGSAPAVRPAARPEFGDYQANGVMAAAKELKANPRRLAQEVIGRLDVADVAARVEVAGPGFINITVRNDWLGQELTRAVRDPRHGVRRAARRQTVVVDYSSPNLAKEMHVGHLRSTIIGDAVVRTLELLGHRVVRQNHVGDWGTQFGMLIAHMVELKARYGGDLATELADLEAFYRESKQRYDNDPAFAALARAYVVRLQSGDAECRALWQAFIDESLRHCEAIYARLGVTLKHEDVMPESAYNADLPVLVEELKAAGLAVESDGAQCVFLPEFVGKGGEPLPVIVQKSDGGYLYATTDLAALRHRVRRLHAERVLYFVDARQQLHLQQMFAVARAAGWVPKNTVLEHLPFGTMMGQDGKPFKTRTGGTIKLGDLLSEAEQRAFKLVSEKNPTLAEAERRRIARAVGIGAVKYADLAKNRISDYVFDWDEILALDGDTAPYLQYAYARVRSIFRREGATDHPGEIVVAEPGERRLALQLIRFEETLHTVAADCVPHVLCNYLFELAGAFMSFYETCPVLKAEPGTRDSRLLMCTLTADTLRTGLGVLGVEALDQM